MAFVGISNQELDNRMQELYVTNPLTYWDLHPQPHDMTVTQELASDRAFSDADILHEDRCAHFEDLLIMGLDPNRHFTPSGGPQDVNVVREHTLLSFALCASMHSVIRVLLYHGANLDHVLNTVDGETITIRTHYAAALEQYYQDVGFPVEPLAGGMDLD
jgi:hypothetical protein